MGRINLSCFFSPLVPCNFSRRSFLASFFCMSRAKPLHLCYTGEHFSPLDRFISIHVKLVINLVISNSYQEITSYICTSISIQTHQYLSRRLWLLVRFICVIEMYPQFFSFSLISKFQFIIGYQLDCRQHSPREKDSQRHINVYLGDSIG